MSSLRRDQDTTVGVSSSSEKQNSLPENIGAASRANAKGPRLKSSIVSKILNMATMARAVLDRVNKNIFGDAGDTFSWDYSNLTQEEVNFYDQRSSWEKIIKLHDEEIAKCAVDFDLFPINQCSPGFQNRA